MLNQLERDNSPAEIDNKDASSRLFAEAMPQLKIENNNTVTKDSCTPPDGAEEDFMESKACAQVRLDKAEKDMEETFKQVEDNYAEPLKSKLQKSQEDWKTFYKSQTEMMDYLYENSENIDPAAGVKERIKIIQERTELLKRIGEFD